MALRSNGVRDAKISDLGLHLVIKALQPNVSDAVSVKEKSTLFKKKRRKRKKLAVQMRLSRQPPSRPECAESAEVLYGERRRKG